MQRLLIDNKQFSALFDHAGIGILCVNPVGEIMAVNKYVLEEFGYSEKELLHKKVELLIPGRFRPLHVTYRHEYTTHPSSRTMGRGKELSGLKKDGMEFPVQIALGYFENEGKVYALTFINDISSQKEAERALKQLNADLEQTVKERTRALHSTVAQLSNQVKENERKDLELLKALAKEKELNEQKSRFVSMASHEFRTPLTGISAATWLLSKYTKEEEQPQRDKHIHRIMSSLATLNEILDDFLSIDKIEEGRVIPRFSKFDMAAMVEECTGALEHTLKNRQKFLFTNEMGDNSIVYLDPDMFRHILTNLLSNAIKYSPEGSVINVLTKRQGSTFMLKVSDHGIGIPDGEKGDVFNRFIRGSNAVHIQGTGIGLSIVKKYTEMMNGHIEVTSKEHEGTAFIITFYNQGEHKDELK